MISTVSSKQRKAAHDLQSSIEADIRTVPTVATGETGWLETHGHVLLMAIGLLHLIYITGLEGTV